MKLQWNSVAWGFWCGICAIVAAYYACRLYAMYKDDRRDKK